MDKPLPRSGPGPARGPPPPPRGGTPPTQKKKFEETEKFVPLNPLPDKKKIPIEGFDWDSVTRIHGSSDGSSGVLFVFNKDGTGVIKGVDDCNDEAANLLMAHCGINVPSRVPLRGDSCPGDGPPSNAWSKLYDIKKTQNIRYATCDQSTRRRLDFFMKRPQLHLLELVDGSPLNGGEEFISQLIGKSHIKPEAQADTTNILFQFGFISAIDIVLNNWDRIPFYFKNEGNAGNIMLTPTGAVIAIDQTISLIPSAQGYELQYQKHFEGIEAFLVKYLKEKTTEDLDPFTFGLGDEVASLLSPLHRVRAFIVNACQIDIGQFDGIRVFLAGFREGCQALANVNSSTLNGFVSAANAAVGIHSSTNESTKFIQKGIDLMKANL